jgi:apolipoprotein N-acyltransferase
MPEKHSFPFRLGGPYPLAVFSGILLIFSFPPFELHFLAWVALVPLLLAVNPALPASSMLYGLVCGIVFFGGALPWIYNAMHEFGHMSPMVSVCLLALLALYLSLYLALFAWGMARFGKGPGGMMFAPALFVLLEYVRGHFLTGFPWALLAHTQYRMTPVIQIASVTGAAGVTFLIVLVNGAVAHSIRSRADGRRALAAPALAAVAVACAVLWGMARLRALEQAGGAPFKASLIQGNVEQGQKWDPQYRDMVAQKYFSMTAAAAREKPDLIVWPEAAAPFIYGADPDYTAVTRQVVKTVEAPLLFGAIGRDTDGNGTRYYNRAYLITPSGDERSYDKMHLVPFGEYVPLRRVLTFAEKLTQAVQGDTTPGISTAPVKVDGISCGVQICYEIIFPEGARAFAARGARLIVNITNDAWYGHSAASAQHMMSLPFRAVENRVPILRAANTGISCFVTAAGEILKPTPLFETMILTGTVIIPPQQATFYTRFGDIFTFICIVTAGVAFPLFRAGRKNR